MDILPAVEFRAGKIAPVVEVPAVYRLPAVEKRATGKLPAVKITAGRRLSAVKKHAGRIAESTGPGINRELVAVGLRIFDGLAGRQKMGVKAWQVWSALTASNEKKSQLLKKLGFFLFTI